MTPFTAVTWALGTCLGLVFVDVALVLLVLNQRDELRELRAERRGTRADRELVVDMTAENNRLHNENHDLSRQCQDLAELLADNQRLIATYVSDAIDKEFP